MDFTPVKEAARGRLDRETWDYFLGSADGDHDRDTRAWSRWDLVPRVLTELTTVDTSVDLSGETFASPLVLAPSASQGAADPEGEIATRRAGAERGLLVAYSFHATVEVERFADAADAPWWAQAFTIEDRAISDGYLRRCAAAGASAVVLTVDVPGSLADTPWRRLPLPESVANRGNYPRDDQGRPLQVATEKRIGPDDIARTADISGLPVWVKGIMTPEDADRAINAGAAGIYVSNHGRRQLASVAPTASVLGHVMEGVEGRAPVLVDGGVRSGTDVVRALALGATAVAVGRPVPWALAAGGRALLELTLDAFIDEIRAATAGLGAGRVQDLVPGMVQPAFV